MSDRPPVSVVMPFAGDTAAAERAIVSLRALETRPGDELVLADNSGTAPSAPGITIVSATRERSPAHARNAGAEQASGEFILFLDADCEAPPGLLDVYFAAPIPGDVAAVAGEVRPTPDAATLAARYGARRNFLSQSAHLAHPFRPRAAAANLLVRRAAFEQIGGFYEGLRAAEDTDFSWRLQEAGWRLLLCEDAVVEHRYRASVRELRRQWRGYAAGRAWLARRYSGFVPEPAVRRALRRAVGRGAREVKTGQPATSGPTAGGARREPAPATQRGRLERGRFLALDALLAAEELTGFTLSNRPHHHHDHKPAQTILIADHFPTSRDPLADLAHTLAGARVEAAARSRLEDLHAVREIPVQYREDDGIAERALALAALAAHHPLRCADDLRRRSADDPKLNAIAPAVRRIQAQPNARVLALGTGQTRQLADRMTRLAGRPLQQPDGDRDEPSAARAG